MKKLTSLLLASTFIVGVAGASELRDEALDLFKALPSTVPNVADNPTSPEKVDLGRHCSLTHGCQRLAFSAVIPVTI